jgi:hypothetical protein
VWDSLSSVPLSALLLLLTPLILMRWPRLVLLRPAT